MSGRAALLTRRRLAWLGGAALMVVGLVWVLAFSSLLGAKHVQVQGTSVLSRQAITTAAGIGTGAPLLRLDTEAIAHRVERLPDVASATVSTRLPSTVTITVQEREPVGYVVASDGYMLVDKTGRQFRAVSAAPSGLPKFLIPSVPSDAQSGDDATGQGVASVAAALSSQIRSRLTSINSQSPSSITLQLADGRWVRWGRAEQNAEKAALLPALLEHAGTVFDVSDPSLVYSH
ncbi:cell division protein FtsQ [Jatrophihabitans sp. GAS493]|uniref:cell division protein FtsQ/DivIB n=1 Tax=Jatrophihabitans sp. GAS493 TaxID=1907575 RepID=UPI000BB8BBEE|nr:FtsQ-type POTRA domain-containing protein [Jatrophihabitans sp. GAS493]SOD74324.1 cell division protein FtsQ [Jatrophihabitans sp. GAS493]